MRDPRLTRRTLIQGTGATLAGAIAADAAATPALAQHDHAEATPVGTPAAEAVTIERGPEHGGYQFLGHGEAELVAAIADRIIPSDDLGPGAVEAGVVQYIDRALAGFYSDNQADYQRGLQAVNAFAQERFGQPFVDLTAEQQDELLEAMDQGTATGFDVPSAQTFFRLIRRHVMEGFLADPVYGGNRDFAGWRLVNFPGAVFAYTPEEMAEPQVLNRPFVSLADWFPPLD